MPPGLSSLTLDINLTDGRPHKVSFYLLDFWASQLSSAIQVLDASTGAVLRSRFLPEDSFMGGQYVSWDLSGHVLVRFTDPSRAQSGTVVSAVFFDPPSAPSPVPVPHNTPPKIAVTFPFANSAVARKSNSPCLNGRFSAIADSTAAIELDLACGGAGGLKE